MSNIKGKLLDDSPNHISTKGESDVKFNKKSNRCHYCTKKFKIAAEIQCKYCNFVYCITHSAPDFHECELLDVYINDQKNQLINSVLTSKCSKDKISNRI